MKPGRRTAAAALMLLLAACGDAGGDARGAAAAADTAATAGPLRLLLDVPPKARAGESIAVTGTLVNEGTEVVTAGVGETLALDVVVTRADGTEVWRRSRHQPLAPGAERTLRPGEVLATGIAWQQRDDAGERVPPGTYFIRGYLEAAPRTLRSALRRVEIE